MKAMIFSDLVTSKNSFLTLFGITIFVGLFIAISTNTLITAVACVAAMIPFMYLFSIAAYDEQNGWERFRLTLPISRKQVAYGRYASTFIIMVCSLVTAVAIGLLIGAIAGALPHGTVPEGLTLTKFSVPAIFGVAVTTQLIILIATTFTLPLIMRYGMTKGSRLVPIVLVIALSVGVAFFGNNLDIAMTNTLFNNATSITLLLAVLTVVAIVLYVASAILSARLYENREL